LQTLLFGQRLHHHDSDIGLVHCSPPDDPRDIFKTAFCKIERHNQVRGDSGKARERICGAQSKNFVPDQQLSGQCLGSAHANESHITMATRPASASEIR
jgi:hypothetical protein